MPQSRLLKARGLYSFPNQLSELPEGALVKADNVNIDRNSVIEPRRGLAKFGTDMPSSDDRAKQLLAYKGRILRHFDSTLQFDSDGSGTFSSFSGSFSEVESGLRIKAIEANSNLYFTSSEGVQKISATSANEFTTASNYIRNAGGVKALDVTGTIDYSTAGFFVAESKVAYRIVWGVRDTNNNLILGTPSSRLELTNFSTTTSGTVELQFSIPSQITTTDTDYFYQVYRTAVVEAGTLTLDDISAGDEMKLVIEGFPTSSELTTTRIVTVDDITPESFRIGGANLYTNEVSGEGILQANEPPPLSKDLTEFKGSIFYSNTQTLHRLSIDLLSVSALVSGTSTFTITDGSTTNTYTFRGAAEVTPVTCVADIAGSLNNTYFNINSASDERQYYVWYDVSGGGTDPAVVGRLPIPVAINTGDSANTVAIATASAIDAIDDFSAPSPGGGAVVTITNTKNGNTTDASDAGGTGFTVGPPSTQGDGEDASLNEVLLSSAATTSLQLDETARSLINIINKNSSEIVSAFYLSGAEDVPGQILLEGKDLSIGEFYITVDSAATASQFSPTPDAEISGTAATGTGTVTITSASHGLSNGDQIVLYNSATTPNIDGVYTISGATVSTFDISTTVTVSGAVTFAKTDVNSDNDVTPNQVYFSKFQEPEAVPLVNNIPLGAKDKEILRILPLRESLFVLKEDGVYRITGEAGSFASDLFDGSTSIIAPDSAAILNNQIYMLSTEGVVTISDTGISVVSRPIEDQLVEISSDNFNFKFTTFGVSYDTERAYHLWTVTNESDSVATQCFRWNSFTNNWTKWPISKTCSIVNPENNRLYTGAGDENFIEQERKDFKRTDYADRQFDLTIPDNAIGDFQIELSSNSDTEKGDALVQTQYVTISTYNRLLKKLDLDPFLLSDYFSSLELEAGDDLSTSMTNLVTKLNTDPSTASVYSFSGTTDFATIQTEYNTIITTLNSDTGVKFTNYRNSEGTVDVEVIITERVKNSNLVNVRQNAPYLKGPIVLYKVIATDVIWAPYTFGDPSIRKQVREGTIMFENTVFSLAELSYSSDLSPDFEEIDFSGSGNGDWSAFSWSEQNWGGGGSSVPFRTYVPRDKQRCRFINKRFKHEGAREKFSVFGISFTFRPLSERAYRDT